MIILGHFAISLKVPEFTKLVVVECIICPRREKEGSDFEASSSSCSVTSRALLMVGPPIRFGRMIIEGTIATIARMIAKIAVLRFM